eukprot:gene31898-41385_t
MGCSLLDCAKCCTVFSFSGLIFLLIIGSLLHTQPLYIKGPKHPAAASTACYEGALIYLGTFALSIAYWFFNGLGSALFGKSGNSTAVTSHSEETSRFGGKYGAVSHD